MVFIAEEEYLLPLPGIERKVFVGPARSPVTILTELAQLFLVTKPCFGVENHSMQVYRLEHLFYTFGNGDCFKYVEKA